MRLLDHKGAAAITQVSMRRDVPLTGVKSPARLAMVPRLLADAAFGDPVVPLVAVEEIVPAVGKRRRSAVVEFKERRAMAGRRARPVEPAHVGAHVRHKAATEQPDDLDLMDHLVEGDAAAGRMVEFLAAVRPHCS